MTSAEGHSEVIRCQSLMSKGVVYARRCGPRGLHRNRTDDDHGGAGLLSGWTQGADLVSCYEPLVLLAGNPDRPSWLRRPFDGRTGAAPDVSHEPTMILALGVWVSPFVVAQQAGRLEVRHA